jgi:hypothetical protein
MIVPVVLYGTETWSLTLKGEHRVRVRYDDHNEEDETGAKYSAQGEIRNAHITFIWES